MNTEIKSAEEIVEKYITVHNNKVRFLHPTNALEAIKEYHNQFTPAIVGGGVEEAAEKYAKQFYGKSMSEFSEFHRCKNNFIAGWKAAQEQPIKSVEQECKSGKFEHNKSIFHLGQCHTCYGNKVID